MLVNKSYASNRLWFSSEYDRLNPASAREGVNKYRSFYSRKLADFSPEEQKLMKDKLENNIYIYQDEENEVMKQALHRSYGIANRDSQRNNSSSSIYPKNTNFRG